MKRRILIVGLTALFISSNIWAQTALSLQNAQWKVEIEPSTLAIKVEPAGRKTLQVTAGMAVRPVSGLQVGTDQVSWHWKTFKCAVQLIGPDLFLTIWSDSPTSLEVFRQLSPTLGKGLILPLAEGHYIPMDNILWRDFLVNKLGEVDTSEGLSLPLWGMDYGIYSLHWIVTNPFNNHLSFRTNHEKQLILSLTHEFTKLSSQTPFTFLLHLAGPDLLAGAKRYRAWLISEGHYASLKSKIAKTPNGEKLLGASHIYLWGNGLLAAQNIKNWPRLLTLLRSETGTEFRKHLDPEALAIVKENGLSLQPYQKRVLISSLNKIFEDCARNQWLHTADAGALVNSYDYVKRDTEQRFARVIDADSSNWGGTLTPAFFKQLADAGLKKLWIGLGAGWEGGLWHPEAVSAAIQYGFLIAPYDSYETAIPPGTNHDWTTACLGSGAPEMYGIVQSNGLLQPGFQNVGSYTNPRLVRPLLEKRVRAIKEKAGFNSWFLDAYGTGMVFEDYRAGKEMTMAQCAAENENSSRWIAENLKMPSGSEGGNATTSGGIFFAHGMQTPFFAWEKKFKKEGSPFYLGRWWPAEEPSIFFQPAVLPEPYRTVYFDPSMRLPLYQAVFHGSVITTHHWLFDSLKLSNVRIENELTQLLYNVPPLYHLSMSSLATRLPQIVRQDAFFRPLHERLGLESLTDFRWLSQDHRVQQTTFAEGTRLIANFRDETYHGINETLPAYSITAIQPGRLPITYCEIGVNSNKERIK